MKTDQFILLARKQIGTPFRHMGRAPGRALDCAGFAGHMADVAGVRWIDVESYGPNPSGGILESALDAQPCLRREYRQPIAGDLLLMRFAESPQHLALCAGETIIHSWAGPGLVCEHRFTDQWRRRVVRVYSFVGVEQ